MEFAKRIPTNGVLFLIIWLLLTVIGLSFIFRSDDLCSPERDVTEDPQPNQSFKPRWRTQVERRREGGPCDTRDGHYPDLADSTKPDYSWRQMKWIGEPAECLVRGELIEKLDEKNNFRRGYALHFSDNVEDRTHILPWLLGSRVDMNRRQRRVFLDLGSNRFQSSIQWFLRMYPCDFTEIHAFEIVTTLLKIPEPFDEYSNRATDNTNARQVKTRPNVPAWMLKRIKVYNKLVSDVDDSETSAVNITRFIKEELKLRPEDAVVVKMDIEESEWPILTRWSNDPEMAQIVDEIFVEVHYKHPSMYHYHWEQFSHERGDATRLLSDLRWKGFYAHFWP